MPELDSTALNNLSLISEGSIGRALDLAISDGIAIQNDIMNFLGQMPEINFSELRDFSAKIGQARTAAEFETMAVLLLRVLSRLIPYASGNSRNVLKSKEIEIFKHLMTYTRLDQWLDVWDETNGLLNKAIHLNLDRKQLILNIFLNISKATRGG